jgi:aspartate/methionine/tyrosine aminotransferase
MVIPAHLFDAVNKIQDTNLICPPAVSQRAALAALGTGAAYCRPHVARLSEVRDLVRQELDQVSDICTAPEVSGAFYFLLRIHTRMDAFTLAERLIREHGVAGIPGTAFGLKDGCYLRISYGALDRQSVAAGVSRLVAGLRALVSS